MAQKIPQQIKENIDAYVSVIKKEIPVFKVYLFGSHAKGTARKDSDIDIAVISPVFRDNKRYDGRWLMRKLWDVPFKNMDVVGFTPQEFENRSSPLIDEIRKAGVLVE